MVDQINHPAHYNSGKIEVIEFIEDQGWARGFCLGNAVKYAARAGKKDPAREIEDLKKAGWYLQRFIELLEAEKEGRAPVRPNDMNKKAAPVSTEGILVCTTCESVWGKGTEQAASIQQTGKCIPCVMNWNCDHSKLDAYGRCLKCGASEKTP